MNEELGPALRRLRIGKGYTQRSVADKLCEQAGLATVTRHEVSRWERQLRLPGDEWLRHLAAVLDTPLAHLTAARTTAAARQRRRARRGQPAGPRVGTPRGHARTPAPARLSLRYAHRTASVRVEATYHDPARAEGALTAFRTMIAGLLAAQSRIDGTSRIGTAAGAGSGADTGAGTGAGLGAGGAAAGAARPGGTVPGGARPGGAASRGARPGGAASGGVPPGAVPPSAVRPVAAAGGASVSPALTRRVLAGRTPVARTHTGRTSDRLGS